MNHELTVVIIAGCEGCLLFKTNEDVATTLIAVVSEDPTDWQEMMACWPRYKNCAVPEFASHLDFESVEKAEAMKAVAKTDVWVFLDLVQKRILSGKEFQKIERDACFAMYTDENGDQHDPLSVHLAPWWELTEQTEPETIARPRSTPIKFPFVDRNFLFGESLIEYLADRVLQVASTETGRQAIMTGEPNRADDLYQLSVEIHRGWLLTPRDEIGGRIPREMLHGGMNWIEQLAWSQQLRFEHGGHPIVALPKELSGYANGPMGREEIALYFDLCRELLVAAWNWCTPEKTISDRSDLIEFLHVSKTHWLNGSFEGGSPPAFIIECSRRRVPRGAGVEIVGMSERQWEEHLIDCDCPICLMMADGSMGVGFAGIDGHHLELDEDFAFSLHETREAWEEQQREWAEMSAKFAEDSAQRERKIAAGEIEPDEFESVWSGPAGESIPGGPDGNLQLAFLLAEVVSALEQKTHDQGGAERSESGIPSIVTADEIKQLNANFTAFRTSDLDQLAASAKTLSATLEQVAEQHPDLIPRIADFQSRIEDRLRQPVSGDENIDDIPF